MNGVRPAHPSDARALRAFRCSTGRWFEEEAQTYVTDRLARRVAHGYPAWLSVDDGQIVGVAAHEPRAHPAGTGETITYLAVAATSVASRTDARDGIRMARLLRAVVNDVKASDRAPYWYTLVAAENEGMCRMLEQFGFVHSLLPSDPRYRLYLAPIIT